MRRTASLLAVPGRADDEHVLAGHGGQGDHLDERLALDKALHGTR